jgi:hypothetical protein
MTTTQASTRPAATHWEQSAAAAAPVAAAGTAGRTSHAPTGTRGQSMRRQVQQASQPQSEPATLTVARHVITKSRGLRHGMQRLAVTHMGAGGTTTTRTTTAARIGGRGGGTTMTRLTAATRLMRAKEVGTRASVTRTLTTATLGRAWGTVPRMLMAGAAPQRGSGIALPPAAHRRAMRQPQRRTAQALRGAPVTCLPRRRRRGLRRCLPRRHPGMRCSLRRGKWWERQAAASTSRAGLMSFSARVGTSLAALRAQRQGSAVQARLEQAALWRGQPPATQEPAVAAAVAVAAAAPAGMLRRCPCWPTIGQRGRGSRTRGSSAVAPCSALN